MAGHGIGRPGELGLFRQSNPQKKKVNFEGSVSTSNEKWTVLTVQTLFSGLSNSEKALENMGARSPSPMIDLAIDCLKQLTETVSNVLAAPAEHDNAPSIKLG